jgi:inward rectifier potassium channel
MALLENKPSSKADKTHLGTNACSYGGRFVNKNGSANVEKQGMPILQRISWYHTMIDMAVWRTC